MIKRIVACIIIGVMTVGFLGCSHKDTSNSAEASKTETSAEDSKYKELADKTYTTDARDFEKIIDSDKTFLELGKYQAEQINKVFMKYGAKDVSKVEYGKVTAKLLDRDEAYGGYTVGGNPKDKSGYTYDVDYDGKIGRESSKGNLTLNVDITIKKGDKFDLDKAEALKDLIQALGGGKYDFNANDTNKWINKFLTEKEEGSGLNNDYRSIGCYRERVEGGKRDDGTTRFAYQLRTYDLEFK